MPLNLDKVLKFLKDLREHPGRTIKALVVLALAVWAWALLTRCGEDVATFVTGIFGRASEADVVFEATLEKLDDADERLKTSEAGAVLTLYHEAREAAKTFKLDKRVAYVRGLNGEAHCLEVMDQLEEAQVLYTLAREEAGALVSGGVDAKKELAYAFLGLGRIAGSEASEGDDEARKDAETWFQKAVDHFGALEDNADRNRGLALVYLSRAVTYYNWRDLDGAESELNRLKEAGQDGLDNRERAHMLRCRAQIAASNGQLDRAVLDYRTAIGLLEGLEARFLAELQVYLVSLLLTLPERCEEANEIVAQWTGVPPTENPKIHLRQRLAESLVAKKCFGNLDGAIEAADLGLDAIHRHDLEPQVPQEHAALKVTLAACLAQRVEISYDKLVDPFADLHRIARLLAELREVAPDDPVFAQELRRDSYDTCLVYRKACEAAGRVPELECVK